MKVSRKWIDWAHGPGAEDGQSLAMTLCDLASSPGTGAVCVTDPVLIAELVDVAELYRNPCAGDALFDMGLWSIRPLLLRQNGSCVGDCSAARP